MSISKLFTAAVLALGLALGSAPSAIAAEPHGHDAAVQLRLDNGRKWQTDDALRRGMGEIRRTMAEALTPIHRGAYTPVQYDALAARIQTHVDDVVQNCRLPEEADEQLHLVLEQILDGIAAMKGDGKRDQGAVGIVAALKLYGDHFDHAGWQPLTH